MLPPLFVNHLGVSWPVLCLSLLPSVDTFLLWLLYRPLKGLPFLHIVQLLPRSDLLGSCVLLQHLQLLHFLSLSGIVPLLMLFYGIKLFIFCCLTFSALCTLTLLFTCSLVISFIFWLRLTLQLSLSSYRYFAMYNCSLNLLSFSSKPVHSSALLFSFHGNLRYCNDNKVSLCHGVNLPLNTSNSPVLNPHFPAPQHLASILIWFPPNLANSALLGPHHFLMHYGYW